MTDPQGIVTDRLKAAYGAYPPVDPLLRDAHDLIERLQRESKELKQTLAYAREELSKADKRAQDFANEAGRLQKREALWQWCAVKTTEMYGGCYKPEYAEKVEAVAKGLAGK